MEKSSYVFGREMSFEKAFPNLEDIIVEYKQYKFLSPAASGEDLPRRHSIRRDGGQIVCDNPACSNGGFRIDSVINDSDAEDKTGTMSCSGHEKMGQGQKRSCLSQIKYRIRLVPKAEATTI
jgi:hypothetical protein